MAARKKGERPKTGGRKAGTPNKISASVKEAIKDIVEGNVDKVQQMLSLVAEPKDFILLYIKLAEFVIPKQASVSVSSEEKKSDLKSELAELANKEL